MARKSRKSRRTQIYLAISVVLLAGTLGFVVEPSPVEAGFVRCQISKTVTLPTETALANELATLPPDAIEGTARSGFINVWAGTDSKCRAQLAKGAVFVRASITLSIRLASEPTTAEAHSVGGQLFGGGMFATWPEGSYPSGWSYGNGSGFSGQMDDPDFYNRYRTWANAGVGYSQQLGGRGVTEAYLQYEDCFPSPCTFNYEYIGIAGDINGNLDYGYSVVLPFCGLFADGAEPDTTQCIDGSALPEEKPYSSTYAVAPFLGARVQITGQMTYQVVAKY